MATTTVSALRRVGVVLLLLLVELLLLLLLLPLEGGLASNGVSRVECGEGGRACLFRCYVVYHIRKLFQLIVLCAGQHPGADIHIVHALQQGLENHLVPEGSLLIAATPRAFHHEVTQSNYGYR